MKAETNEDKQKNEVRDACIYNISHLGRLLKADGGADDSDLEVMHLSLRCSLYCHRCWWHQMSVVVDADWDWRALEPIFLGLQWGPGSELASPESDIKPHSP